MIIFRVHFCNSKVRVPFFIHFSFILSFNFEKKWNGKWMKNGPKMPTVNDPNEKWIKNGTLTLLLQKWPGKWSLFIFLAVCLEGKMHFYSIFPKFVFQGFHGNHFSHHFSHHFWFSFVCFSAKYMKMSQKWVWAKNGPKMATVNNPIYWVFHYTKLSLASYMVKNVGFMSYIYFNENWWWWSNNNFIRFPVWTRTRTCFGASVHSGLWNIIFPQLWLI